MRQSGGGGNEKEGHRQPKCLIGHQGDKSPKLTGFQGEGLVMVDTEAGKAELKLIEAEQEN